MCDSKVDSVSCDLVSGNNDKSEEIGKVIESVVCSTGNRKARLAIQIDLLD